MSPSGDGKSEEPATLSVYTVRVSDRSRRVRFTMRHEGLEVVIPRGFDQRRIPGLLEEKRGWIERAAREIEQRQQRLDEYPPELPDHIELAAVGEVWLVEYRSRSAGGRAKEASSVTPRVRETRGCRLVVSGDSRDFAGCRKALRRWLSSKAKRTLAARVDTLSLKHGFDFNKVTVRQQRTRWGSCSRKGNISLNALLLLMPPEAVDYVILHELCHTRRMDHSRAYWKLLERHDPEYESHKRLVRESAKSLPAWIDHEPRGFDM